MAPFWRYVDISGGGKETGPEKTELIITKQKPLGKVLEMAQPYGKVFLIGCGTCATGCQTGGEEQVKAMAENLKGRIIGTAIVESPCDLRMDRRDLGRHREALQEADAILVMCCGAGAQTLAEFTGKAVIPALDTVFIGKTERIGRYYERCRACTDCLLLETGGICPTVRCSKGLLNGPCGGQVRGKCEVGGYTRDCGWVLIYESLKKQKRLEAFKRVRTPKDRSPKAQPQEVVER